MATDDRRPPLLTPTAADPLQVLVAGGPADIARELRAWLAPRGLRVAHHWPSDKVRCFERPIPAGTDFVIVLIGHLGHSACDAVVAACRRAGVRFVRSLWNRSRLALALEQAGVRLQPPRPEFDPTPEHEEADAPPAPARERCAYVEGGRRCYRDAQDGDALCAEHRRGFDAQRPPESCPRCGREVAGGASCDCPPVAVLTPTPDETVDLSGGLTVRASDIVSSGVLRLVEDKRPSARRPAADAPPTSPAQGEWPAGCVPSPTKEAAVWAPAHVEALTKLVEAGGDDAAKLVRDLHAATGTYRAPGGLAIFLRPLVAVGVKAHPRLLRNLEALSKAQTAAKRVAEAAELGQLKRGKVLDLVSRAAAVKLLGGVGARLDALEGRIEVATGRLVYRRADVLARKAALEQVAGGPLGKERVTIPLVPDDELQRRLERELRGGPGRSANQLAEACHVDRPRVSALLERWEKEKKAASAPRPGKPSQTVWGPAGWAPAPAAKKTPCERTYAEEATGAPRRPVPPAPKPAKLDAPSPAVAAILQLVKDKVITAEQSVPMLAAVSGGK